MMRIPTVIIFLYVEQMAIDGRITKHVVTSSHGGHVNICQD